MNQKTVSFNDADDYLKVAEKFKLGHLPTESQHPKTRNLSSLAKDQTIVAIEMIRDIDLEAIDTLFQCAPQLDGLRAAISETISQNNRVFIAGCGATGRLALSLEFLWRSTCQENLKDSVVAFMAGGDIAVVRSIENFEDHPEFGERQLLELGFTADDLLIGVTEGGETPFVIGATECAARISKRAPFFLFCNPFESLKSIERSRKVIEDSKIHSISISVGPMVLSGSTRLQASTILMAAVGFCLIPQERERPFLECVENLSSAYRKIDLKDLCGFIEEETQLYRDRKFVHYETEQHGICVLTDTTERHPTFSITPFENAFDKNAEPSLCYLIIPGAFSSEVAWKKILGREPRALNWFGFEHRVSYQRLLGFDFSVASRSRRGSLNASVSRFEITKKNSELCLLLSHRSMRIPVPESLLIEHLLLKMILNIHSTLVMGRLGRFEGNVMTWVKPSNGKLVDRSIRYIDYLFQTSGVEAPSYEVICRALFAIMPLLKSDQSVVLETFKALGFKKPIIFFDGHCVICNSAVDFILKIDKRKRFMFAPLQGQTAEFIPESLKIKNSILYLKDGLYRAESDAIAEILSDSGGVFSGLRAMKILPRWGRDGIYRFIAENRNRFIKRKTQCRVVTPQEQSRFLP